MYKHYCHTLLQLEDFVHCYRIKSLVFLQTFAVYEMKLSHNTGYELWPDIAVAICRNLFFLSLIFCPDKTLSKLQLESKV